MHTWLDRLLPPRMVAGDDDTLHRARLVLALALVLFVGSLTVLSLRLAHGVRLGPMMFVGPGLVASLPLLLRWTQSLVLLGNVLAAVIFLGFSLVVLRTGGVGTAAMFGLGVAPLVAVLVAGRRSGTTWALLATAELGWLAWARAHGAVFEPMAPAAGEAMQNYGAIVLMWALLGLMMAYETMKNSALAKLRRARVAAEAASVAKSEFLANMSHEIRTPMNGVLASLDLLAQAELSHDDRGLLRTARSSAIRLLSLLDDVLDVAKIEAGRMGLELVPFDLRELLADACELLRSVASAKGLPLELAYPEGLPTVFVGDPTRVRQVVNNLLGNAVKFTREGSVTVRVSAETDGRARAWVRIEVADTGVGIPVGVQTGLFEKFTQADASTTRDYGGSGLGLAISRDLTELMGGRIGLDSTPGEGSTFWVELPMPVGDRTPVPDGTQTPAPRTERFDARVLVADDNPVNSRLAALMLNRMGCTVETVADGEAAVSAVAERPFDVVFMDCQMPELDGYEACRLIRAAGHDVPVVALTANAMEGDREQCLEAGMDDYLAKPLRVDALAGALSRWVGRRHTSAA